MAFGDFAIAPSTTVTLCAGVPLSKDSEDTLYFGSAGAQASSIGSYAIGTFSNITYQRNTRNTIRVEIPEMKLSGSGFLRANYCVFNNTAFENKPIYCFVDTIDYVNNNTADIHFTIDAMQTFMFDYELKACYVEREHEEQDVFGSNTVPEELPTYDAVINGVDDTFLISGSGDTKYQKVIYSIPSVEDITDPSEVQGETINNIYTPVKVEAWNTAATANGAIGSLLMLKHNLVGVVMVPPIIPSTVTVTSPLRSSTVTMDATFGTGGSAYTPKNKKMFTYPYNYLVVSNNSGTEKQYRWEFFAPNGMGNRPAVFSMYGAMMPSPEMALVPTNYRGMQVNYADMVTFNNFPTSPWSEDSYINWLNSNKNSYDAGVISNGVSSAMSAVGGALAGAAVGGMEGGLAGTLGGPAGTLIGAGIGAASGIVGGVLKGNQMKAQKADQKAAPDKVGGNASACAIAEVLGNTGFTIYKMQIPVSLAMTIDDYFTMYGYARHRVKVPNRNVRPHWTYTKTQGCTIYGNVPAEFAREIEARYNNGVRFWVSASEVGNYSLDNSV